MTYTPQVRIEFALQDAAQATGFLLTQGGQLLALYQKDIIELKNTIDNLVNIIDNHNPNSKGE
jgi:hypothetical protein